MNTKIINDEYVAGTYARFPLELVGGKGSIVWDENGKKYIDMGTGIAVNIYGIADEKWNAAVTEQLGKIAHASNLYYTAPSAKLAQILCEKTGMKKVFFGNSGAEANECAIKAARKYSSDKYSSDRNVIITLIDSFHGRTVTTLAATGQDEFHNSFLPLTGGFIYTPANDCEALIALVDANPNVCAFMFECVQGEGGVMPLTQEFVDCMDKLAREKDILLVCDEVQAGNGRCGAVYSYMNYGITPDVVSTAKGLGGGLPLGACLLGEKLKDTLGAVTHGSTFGGNPVACAGAVSIMNRLDDEMLAGVKARHDFIVDTLIGSTGIEFITGAGLMLGVKTVRPAGEIIAECMENGLLVIKAKEKVRLLPALNIPMEDLAKGMEILKAACAKI